MNRKILPICVYCGIYLFQHNVSFKKLAKIYSKFMQKITKCYFLARENKKEQEEDKIEVIEQKEEKEEERDLDNGSDISVVESGNISKIEETQEPLEGEEEEDVNEREEEGEEKEEEEATYYAYDVEGNNISLNFLYIFFVMCSHVRIFY